MPLDLYDTIQDAVDDSQLPDDTSSTMEVESTPAPEPAQDDTVPAPETPATDATPTETPTTPTETDVDDFEKKHGIPARTADGARENRIPYSRVKKITSNAVSEAVAAKTKEYEPKLADLTTKVQSYEARLDKVDKFEKVMVNDPNKFLNMLATIPAYTEFFKLVRTAYQQANGGAPQATGAKTTPTVGDDMPQPDEKLSDGSMVYSMDGLRALNAWNRAAARKETLTEVEKIYGPIAAEWQTQQRVQAVIPHVRAQIEDAKTWPLFNENENEIVAALQADQALSLDGAYRKVVFPKLVADRNKVRGEVLKEVQQAPRSTSAPVSAGKPTQVSAGPRKIEDIILESIKTLK